MAANNEAPTAATAEAPTTNATPSGTDSKYPAKRFATLAAAAALNGSTLYRLEDGRYLLARWGLSRELATIDDVARFLASMGIRT
ncbi:MAG: hypothetical protein ACLGIT_11570 [Gammaproteobacteria bacterium]